MTTTPSARAREAAADVLDEISALLSHDGIGQVADLIRDGEYDEHDVMPIFARFEAEIREQCASFIEQNMQVVSSDDRHPSYWSKRRDGNLYALEYATAIRENRP